MTEVSAEVEIVWLNENPNLEYVTRRSLKRWINSKVVTLQQRLKTQRVYGYPRHLIVDVVNQCGLKCPICPNGCGEIPRKTSRMHPELFSDIIDTLGPWLYTLTLTNWGEPLSHPQLPELLKIARRSPAYIGFSTNLQYLPDTLMDQIIQSGVDEIGISIDGSNSETYKKYRIGGDFDTAIKNMKRLVNRRAELKCTSPKIRWQVLLNRYTETQTESVIEMAESIGVDSVIFVPIYLDISGMFTRSPMERMERQGDWLPDNPAYRNYDVSTGRLKGDPRFCSKLWDSMVIHPDGAISPCCAVIDPQDDFAQFSRKSSFLSIWNNDKYQQARKRISGRCGSSGTTVCEHCIEKGILIY